MPVRHEILNEKTNNFYLAKQEIAGLKTIIILNI